MDWKREAVDKLRIHSARQNSLNHMKAEIVRLTQEAESVRSPKTDGVPVMGGGNVREERLITNIAQRVELRKAYGITKSQVAAVAKALETLSDEERLVIDRFYINRAKGNVERLCEELNIEKATVYRRRDSAIRHFTIALYGVIES